MFKKIHLLILGYFIAAAVYITYPLVFHLADALPGRGDELLITWILNWNIHALLHNPLQLFNANIYYPYENSLAFSDTHLISSLLTLFPILLFKEPAIAYNLTLIFAFVLLGFFTYVLVYFLTKNPTSGVISGTLVSFSTYTIGKTMHPQLISIQWIPLALLFFLLFLEKKKQRYFLLTSFFFLVQTYNSFLPGYFLLFSYGSILAVAFINKKISLGLFLNKRIIVSTAITFLLLLPIVLPYYLVSSKFNYVRDIREAIHTANRPEYTFFSFGKSKLAPLINGTVYKDNKGPFFYDGYLGLPFILLSLFTIYFRFKHKLKQTTTYFDMFFLMGIIGFVMSMGPALQWGGKVIKLPFVIPLPYALFYYILPGFNGFRNSGRWEMLMVFAFSVMIGIGSAFFFKKKAPLFGKIATAIICFLVLLEATVPLALFPVPTRASFPKIYTYLTTQEKNPLIELPMYTWRMFNYSHKELEREYYSTVHFFPMVNGASGYSPQPWQEQANIFMVSFPSENTIKYLEENGIVYLLLHKSEYDSMEKENYMIENKRVVTWQDIQEKLKMYKNIKLIKKMDDDYLYLLTTYEK